MSLFRPDLDTIDCFLNRLDGRKLDRKGDAIVIVPAFIGDEDGGFADELLKSLQTPLLHFHYAAMQWKGKKGSFPYAHDACSTWRLLTSDRAKSKCKCGQPGQRRRIDVPWLNANRHNRPMVKRRTKNIKLSAETSPNIPSNNPKVD